MFSITVHSFLVVNKKELKGGIKQCFMHSFKKFFNLNSQTSKKLNSNSVTFKTPHSNLNLLTFKNPDSKLSPTCEQIQFQTQIQSKAAIKTMECRNLTFKAAADKLMYFLLYVRGESILLGI